MQARIRGRAISPVQLLAAVAAAAALAAPAHIAASHAGGAARATVVAAPITPVAGAPPVKPDRL